MTTTQLVSKLSALGRDLVSDINPAMPVGVEVLQTRRPCKVRLTFAAGVQSAATLERVKSGDARGRAIVGQFPANQTVLTDPALILEAGGNVSFQMFFFSLEVVDG